MQKKYEILLLLRPNMPEAEKKETISKIEGIVGGTIVKKDEQGLKKLAYPIKKQVEADYTLYYVEAEAQNIVEVKKQINIMKDVLRAMILVHEKDWPFNFKTSADLKFPERKPRVPRRPRTDYNANARTEVQAEDIKTEES